MTASTCMRQTTVVFWVLAIGLATNDEDIFHHVQIGAAVTCAVSFALSQQIVAW